MVRWLICATLMMATGCLHANTAECDDGRVCPSGLICWELTTPPAAKLCVAPDAVQRCVGLPALMPCGLGDQPDAERCYDGVCLEAGCGNGRLDPAEVCDDGNAIVGDLCSASCLSDETCGNGFLDPLKIVAGSPEPDELCDDSNQRTHDGCDSTCTPEILAWREIGLVPSSRQRAAMAYDFARDRIVMMGGERVAGMLFTAHDDVWEWDGAGWRGPSTTSRPVGRRDATIAYDPIGRSMLLFGGVVAGSNTSSETWSWDGATWSLRDPPRSPPARSAAAMTFDSRRGRIVLFGGSDSVQALTDTWEWDGATWTEVVTPTHPDSRTDGSLVFDPARGLSVLVGGTSTWEYDGQWHEVPSDLPAGIGGAVGAYDPIGHVVVAVVPNGTKLETWAWTGTKWTALAPGPSLRAAPQVATDWRQQRVVLFGGFVDGACGPCAHTLADTWTWDGSAWAQITPAIPTLTGPAVAFDPTRGRVQLFGGVGPLGAILDQFWEYDGGHWRQHAEPPPPARYEATMAHSADHTVLFGGVVNGVEANDTWVWTGSAWVQPTLAIAPPDRFLAAMAYDRKRDRVVLFGGHTISGTDLADTWEWDGVRWTALAPPTSPSARSGHQMVYDPVDERIVLFGGANPITLTDTWAWDGTTWTELPATAPPNVSDFALTWDAGRQELQVYDALTNALWVREPTRWRNRPLGGGPPPRTLAAMFRAPDGAGLVVAGGYEQGVVSSDQWELQWSGTSHAEVCTRAIDADGDGLVGCADLDCWAACTPWCPPGASCDPTWPKCGDGVCNPDLETCRSCPGDCACTPLCGDLFCDPGETPSTCPGDCP